jgi:uncharacterized membrane protein
MSENGMRDIYEWIGRKVVKVLFEFGILGMMLMAVLAISITLLKVIDIFYTYPDGIWYRLLAMVIPAGLFAVYGVGRGLHEKIASYIMENSTLEKEEKKNIAYLALFGGIAGGIAGIFANNSIIESIVIAISVFFVFFFVFYGAVYTAKKREEDNRTSALSKT